MNLATAEALRAIYTTAARERNRVSRLLGELAKVALIGEGEELPEVPEIVVGASGRLRDPAAPALTSTERSQIRRDRMRKEREDRDARALASGQLSSAANIAGVPPPMQRDATDATAGATPMQRDATDDATEHATVVASLPGSPPSPVISLEMNEESLRGEGGRGGDAPANGALGATDDATEATADATDATRPNRVAVASSPLHSRAAKADLADHWQRGVTSVTGGSVASLSRTDRTRLAAAILSFAQKNKRPGPYDELSEQLGKEFAQDAKDANIRVHVMSFCDWILAGRQLPERPSGPRKAAAPVQPPGREYQWKVGGGGS